MIRCRFKGQLGTVAVSPRSRASVSVWRVSATACVQRRRGTGCRSPSRWSQEAWLTRTGLDGARHVDNAQLEAVRRGRASSPSSARSVTCRGSTGWRWRWSGSSARWPPISPTLRVLRGRAAAGRSARHRQPGADPAVAGWLGPEDWQQEPVLICPAGARSSGHLRRDATATPICGGSQCGDVQFLAFPLFVERGYSSSNAATPRRARRRSARPTRPRCRVLEGRLAGAEVGL